jgi:hypothetical protein
MSRVSMLLATAIGALAAAAAMPAAAAVQLGQVDDFQDGSFELWDAGLNNPYGPINIPAGGPGGAADRYLQLASGGAGSGGRLVAFNFNQQWSGDYLAAGVTSVRMQVNNQGATDLMLRLILTGAGPDTTAPSLTTASAVGIAAGSGWTTVSFSLASADLQGPAYDLVMSDVRRLTLLHSPIPVAHRVGAPDIAAQLGVDNITAVPEPATLVLAAMGFAALMCRFAGRPRLRRPARQLCPSPLVSTL